MGILSRIQYTRLVFLRCYTENQVSGFMFAGPVKYPDAETYLIEYLNNTFYNSIPIYTL